MVSRVMAATIRRICGTGRGVCGKSGAASGGLEPPLGGAAGDDDGSHVGRHVGSLRREYFKKSKSEAVALFEILPPEGPRLWPAQAFEAEAETVPFSEFRV